MTAKYYVQREKKIAMIADGKAASRQINERLALAEPGCEAPVKLQGVALRSEAHDRHWIEWSKFAYRFAIECSVNTHAQTDVMTHLARYCHTYTSLWSAMRIQSNQ